MPLGEQGLVECERTQRAGLILLLQQAGEAQITLPAHVCLGERGAQHDVRHQVERRLEIPPRDLERDGGVVPVGEGGERRAKECELGLEVVGVATAGALAEHERGEGGEPRCVAVEARAAGDLQGDLHER